MNKIIFFGGKGGVGKTTCSASYALYQAKRGLKTLLVSTDPAHSTSDIFETKINDTISNLLPNLDAIEIKR
jgi:arsenite-transporting ATPase